MVERTYQSYLRHKTNILIQVQKFLGRFNLSSFEFSTLILERRRKRSRPGVVWDTMYKKIWKIVTRLCFILLFSKGHRPVCGELRNEEEWNLKQLSKEDPKWIHLSSINHSIPLCFMRNTLKTMWDELIYILNHYFETIVLSNSSDSDRSWFNIPSFMYDLRFSILRRLCSLVFICSTNKLTNVISRPTPLSQKLLLILQFLLSSYWNKTRNSNK